MTVRRWKTYLYVGMMGLTLAGFAAWWKRITASEPSQWRIAAVRAGAEE